MTNETLIPTKTLTHPSTPTLHTASITPRLLSKSEAIALIHADYGLPIGPSSFQIGQRKLCETEDCPRRPPKPAVRYGNRYFYSPESIRDFAKRLLAEGAVS